MIQRRLCSLEPSCLDMYLSPPPWELIHPLRFCLHVALLPHRLRLLRQPLHQPPSIPSVPVGLPLILVVIFRIPFSPSGFQECSPSGFYYLAYLVFEILCWSPRFLVQDMPLWLSHLFSFTFLHYVLKLFVVDWSCCASLCVFLAFLQYSFASKRFSFTHFTEISYLCLDRFFFYTLSFAQSCVPHHLSVFSQGIDCAWCLLLAFAHLDSTKRRFCEVPKRSRVPKQSSFLQPRIEFSEPQIFAKVSLQTSFLASTGVSVCLVSILVWLVAWFCFFRWVCEFLCRPHCFFHSRSVFSIDSAICCFHLDFLLADSFRDLFLSLFSISFCASFFLFAPLLLLDSFLLCLCPTCSFFCFAFSLLSQIYSTFAVWILLSWVDFLFINRSAVGTISPWNRRKWELKWRSTLFECFEKFLEWLFLPLLLLALLPSRLSTGRYSSALPVPFSTFSVVGRAAWSLWTSWVIQQSSPPASRSVVLADKTFKFQWTSLVFDSLLYVFFQAMLDFFLISCHK